MPDDARVYDVKDTVALDNFFAPGLQSPDYPAQIIECSYLRFHI
jgi:hypothetical protein